MGKGLKQLVEEALTETKPPVTVSGDAQRALTQNVRAWSGWDDATLVFAKPRLSPYAECDYLTRRFTANPDTLVRNPNRVLLTVTPFRLRQEAVLTGALMHEAAHARYSRWRPRSEDGATSFKHSDGTEVTQQTFALAKLMEEPRIEGLMARDARRNGADGLGWTMRASAAALVPVTKMSMRPDQQVMDLITSWALRAGRQIALNAHTAHPLPSWVHDFNNLLFVTLVDHLSEVNDPATARVDASKVHDLLVHMATHTDNEGPTMVDNARDILRVLFPETDGDSDDAPMPNVGCVEEDEQPEPEPKGDSEGDGEGDGQDDTSESESGDDGEGDESGEGGEGDTEPEDEGSGTEPGAGDNGDGDEEGDGDGDEEDSDEDSDDSDADEDADEEGSSGDSDADEDGTESDEDDTSDEGEGSPAGGDAEDVDETSDLARALAAMEAQATSETEDEVEQAASVVPPPPVNDDDDEDEAHGAGAGFGSGGGTWRQPTADERQTQKSAEKFLRDMIDASESSKVMLTDQPSATVDGAALSAWKAGGAIKEPHFFRRTKREVQPSPPVQIAVLVDVSASMEELQAPSALLSWALASAAIDLKNFAGRGTQVESTLIHWGTSARVIQPNGKLLPGIREFPCWEGTSAMHDAHDLVAEQIPGFFDFSERPVNRLLVHFTDWELGGFTITPSSEQVKRALEVGVNMLTVAPRKYSPRYSVYNDILSRCKVQRGAAALMKYNPMFPEQVWDEAAKALQMSGTGTRPSPFPGF